MDQKGASADWIALRGCTFRICPSDDLWVGSQSGFLLRRRRCPRGMVSFGIVHGIRRRQADVGREKAHVRVGSRNRHCYRSVTQARLLAAEVGSWDTCTTTSFLSFFLLASPLSF